MSNLRGIRKQRRSLAAGFEDGAAARGNKVIIKDGLHAIIGPLTLRVSTGPAIANVTRNAKRTTARVTVDERRRGSLRRLRVCTRSRPDLAGDPTRA